jgi:hypothetical protein
MNSSLSSITLNDGNEILAGLISRERTDSMISMGDRDVTFPTLENQNEATPLQRLEELENENRKLREQLKQFSQDPSTAPPLPPPNPPVAVEEPLESSEASNITRRQEQSHPFEVILNRFVEEVNDIMSSLNSSTVSLSMLYPTAEEETKGEEDRKMPAEEVSPTDQIPQTIAVEVSLLRPSV